MAGSSRILAAALLPGLVWASLAWASLATAGAEARRIAAAGVELDYDAALWRAQPGVPPALISLACLSSRCGMGTATLIADPRPFPGPGAGAFTPGAATALLVDLRAQELTPGARLRPEAESQPFQAGSVNGYRSRYRVEDATLRTSGLVDLTIRHRGTALHLRLTGPASNEEAAATLEALAAGLSLLP